MASFSSGGGFGASQEGMDRFSGISDYGGYGGGFSATNQDRSASRSDSNANNAANNNSQKKSSNTGSPIASAILGGLGGLALGGLPGAIAGGFKGYNDPFLDFDFGGLNLGALGANGARSANTGPTEINALGPQSSDNVHNGGVGTFGGSSNNNNVPKNNYNIDTGGFFSEDSAHSIADAILANQYNQTVSSFDDNFARGVITPESYKLSKSNLDAQRNSLGELYRSTALGELTKGKQSLNEMLLGYKNDPTSLTVGEGQNYNDALVAALQARADEFNSGFESSVLGAIGPENQFQKAQAVKAGIPGQAVQSVNPIAAAIANRDQDGSSQRRLGDRNI